ncbi:ABC transporter permease [Ekhidna sp.]
MITSIKLFFRSLKRNKLFSFINILGLTVGFFSSILIYLYVTNEMDYDNFHENGDQVYRINQTFIWGEDSPNLFSATGPGVGYSIKQEIPEAKHVVRVFNANDMLPIKFESAGQERFFNDESVLAVDSNFLEVFTFPLLYGDKNTCFDNPNSAVLTYETAEKFFGSHDVLGATIDMDNGESYKVTGVFQKIEENFYLDEMDVLVSLNSIERIKTSDWNWLWTMFETYILLEDQANPQVVQSKLDNLLEKHAGQTLKAMGYTYEEYIAAGKEWNLYMQPLTDTYLKSDNVISIHGDTGNIKIVVALVGSAIFLLVLSCINFINLSTAQFTTRAQNVAVRKILGGNSSMFVKRFFGEALMYCMIAALFSIMLVFYSVPLINQSLGTTLSFSVSGQPQLIAFLFILIVSVSAVAGFYPFVFFNAFKPISAMKGELKTGRKGVRVRNGMLITQYVLSFLLIIGTITIYEQLNYFLKADLGFEKENILTIDNAEWTGSLNEFADEVAKLEGVVGTSVCDAVPLLVFNGDQFKTDEPDATSLPLNYTLGDENYTDLLDFEFIVGRSFEQSFSSDTASIIINETAAKTIGWAVDESILNKKVENWSGKYKVVGVVRDFNYWGLNGPIEPFAIFHSKSNPNGGRPLTRVLVKTFGNDADMKALEKRLEAKWNEFVPNRPFEYTNLSEHYASSYETEEQFGSVLSFFAVLTIIIASLGLFGIVVFTLEQKLKEIGVRKVLGASVGSIVLLFSKSYIKLLLIAFFVAVPIGYYVMNIWLSDFEYRINMGVNIFAFSLAILLSISLAISIVQTAKASLMNPAEVLKDE